MNQSRWLVTVGLLCVLAQGCSNRATTRLIAQLGDADPHSRSKAARALALPEHAGDARVVPALVRAVGDVSPLVQETAITSLGQFPESAEPALSALAEALHSNTTPVRVAAALAIAKIDSQATNYREVMLESLREGNASMFLEIGQLGRRAEWAAPSLVSLLTHPRTHVRALAARALGEVGIANDQIHSALRQRLKDREPPVRQAAAVALEKLAAKKRGSLYGGDKRC
jgi:HEAT repeat protein